MPTLRGYVDHIIYRNEENGYTVLNLIAEQEEQICVGNMWDAAAGETLELTGDFVVHESYGEQFAVQEWRAAEPEDEEGMERYLSSGVIKGIGPAMAKKILDRFGSDAFRIMEEEPERLAEIKGISERKAREFSDQITEKRESRQVLMFLMEYSITQKTAARIYETYGADVYQVIRTNPYRLAEDVRGIGFLAADEIAKKAGISAHSEFRIRCGIIHVLREAGLEGHTFLPAEELEQRSLRLLRVEKEEYQKGLEDLTLDRRIVQKEMTNSTPRCRAVYLSVCYQTELHTAALLEQRNLSLDIPDEDVWKRIAEVEEEMDFPLAKAQKDAVHEAATSGILILTGGPGTGKTTTIHALIRYFESSGFTVALAAPTGRAAKRMTEMTGCDAKTIHRLLEVSGGAEEGSSVFGRNEENPLETDVVIVDEMSMVDLFLMHSLLLAISPGTRLILTGDENQLPSVGPGAVLKDMISSGRFPMVRLSEIFRQAGGSDIVMNAHAIQEGRAVALNNQSKDFFFLGIKDADRIIEETIRLVKSRLPGYVHANSFEIQVLTPTRKGLLGVSRLNAILQNSLNPKSSQKDEVVQGERIFREGDKVMQTKNNYKRDWEIRTKQNFLSDSGTGVFNGDLGTIRKVDDYNRLVTVEFDEGRVSDYEFKDLEELDLAYALTIHKSQGSEYPAVVIPMIEGPRMLMNRNLLYTAVTRARKCVVLVGSEEVVQKMIANGAEQERYSGLLEMLH